jgi:hypothetical protein
MLIADETAGGQTEPNMVRTTAMTDEETEVPEDDLAAPAPIDPRFPNVGYRTARRLEVLRRGGRGCVMALACPSVFAGLIAIALARG